MSGVQMAISSSNTGGAWDNAKKYIEGNNLGKEMGKGSDVHGAAVIGDTVRCTGIPPPNILLRLESMLHSVVASGFRLAILSRIPLVLP